MKALLLVLDGVGDRPIKELGYRTPLEVANTPNLDRIAELGINGILDPISPGIRAGSDTAHLALLGYDPYEIYTGRGPFEAAGIGLKLERNDIALRCNFATIDENGIVIDRRAGRISEGTEKLAKALNNIKLSKAKIIFKESVAHRAVLILRSKNEKLSYRVSDSDPHEVGKPILKVKPLENSPEAEMTANLLNEFTEKAIEVLKEHEVNKKREKEGKLPANAILMRGAGVTPNLKPFKLSSACIATTGIIKGICKLAGMDIIPAKKEYKVRFKQALEVLEKKEFLLMNIKEPDEAGHDGNFRKKIEIIEKIDESLEVIMEFAEDNYVIILGDHSTPVSVRDHTGDSVPVVICGPEVRVDDVREFNERSCAKGGLNRIKGRDVMPILLDLMNKSEKFGA